VISTRFTERFGVELPIMSAPMAMHSGGTLAGAVSAAGGLGSFGGIHRSGDPGWIGEQVAIVRAATDRPFGIGFITPFLRFAEKMLDASLDAGADVIALSFADPAPWVERIRSAGAKVVCQVQTFDDADLAVAAGVDALVAQGNEAGGHTGTMGLLPFLAAVVERHPDVPVLAAGGIADGRTLAAVLAAGADGAWLGTALLATNEAVEITDDHKQAIVASDGGDTVFTRAYDIASGLPWPATIGERVRRDAFTDEWAEREERLRADRADVTPPAEVIYGQSAAFVSEVRPAADVVRTIVDDAEAILRDRPSSLLS
jgi:nitronate monooxygenase